MTESRNAPTEPTPDPSPSSENQRSQRLGNILDGLIENIVKNMRHYAEEEPTTVHRSPRLNMTEAELTAHINDLDKQCEERSEGIDLHRLLARNYEGSGNFDGEHRELTRAIVMQNETIIDLLVMNHMGDDRVDLRSDIENYKRMLSLGMDLNGLLLRTRRTEELVKLMNRKLFGAEDDETPRVPSQQHLYRPEVPDSDVPYKTLCGADAQFRPWDITDDEERAWVELPVFVKCYGEFVKQNKNHRETGRKMGESLKEGADNA